MAGDTIRPSTPEEQRRLRLSQGTVYDDLSQLNDTVGIKEDPYTMDLLTSLAAPVASSLSGKIASRFGRAAGRTAPSPREIPQIRYPEPPLPQIRYPSSKPTMTAPAINKLKTKVDEDNPLYQLLDPKLYSEDI